MEKTKMSVILFDSNDVIATSSMPTHYLAKVADADGTIIDNDMAAETARLGPIRPNQLIAYDWINGKWTHSGTIAKNLGGDDNFFNDLVENSVYIYNGNNGYTLCTDLSTPFLHDHMFPYPQANQGVLN